MGAAGRLWLVAPGRSPVSGRQAWLSGEGQYSDSGQHPGVAWSLFSGAVSCAPTASGLRVVLVLPGGRRLLNVVVVFGGSLRRRICWCPNDVRPVLGAIVSGWFSVEFGCSSSSFQSYPSGVLIRFSMHCVSFLQFTPVSESVEWLSLFCFSAVTDVAEDEEVIFPFWDA